MICELEDRCLHQQQSDERMTNLAFLQQSPYVNVSARISGIPFPLLVCLETWAVNAFQIWYSPKKREATQSERKGRMVANRIDDSGGLYMTVEQYLALDDATDGKYEYLDGYVFMLRPPSSAYDDQALVDMAGGSVAHAALCARMAMVLGNALGEEFVSGV